jgi:hypothetical protein
MGRLLKSDSRHSTGQKQEAAVSVGQILSHPEPLRSFKSWQLLKEFLIQDYCLLAYVAV